MHVEKTYIRDIRIEVWTSDGKRVPFEDGNTDKNHSTLSTRSHLVMCIKTHHHRPHTLMIKDPFVEYYLR